MSPEHSQEIADLDASLAQLVEPLAYVQGDGGSSPPAGPKHAPSVADIDDVFKDDGSLDTPEVAAQLAAQDIPKLFQDRLPRMLKVMERLNQEPWPPESWTDLPEGIDLQ